MAKRYDWALFFEDGTKEAFWETVGMAGDDHSNDDRMAYSVDDPKLALLYAQNEVYERTFRMLAQTRPLAWIIVNPPVEVEELPGFDE